MDPAEKRRADLIKALNEEEWPQLYMFKFIVKNEEEKIEEVKNLQTENSSISIKTSKNAKFASLTVKETMLNPDDVIARYDAVGQIDGVMSL